MHTPFGPSSLSKRAGCPGSYKEEFLCKKVDTEESTEGTEKHLILQALVETAGDVFVPDQYKDAIASALEHLDTVLAGDEIIPGDMRTKSGGHVYAELRLDHLPYAEYSNEIGTVDLVIVYDDHIIMVDWKMGGHFVDSPKWNYQLKGYALGIWEKFGRKPISVAIIQPAVSPEYQLSAWVYDPGEYDVFASEIKAVIAKCLEHSAPRIVGSSCTFCDARYSCAARSAIYSAFASGHLSLEEAYRSASPTDRGIMINMAKCAIDMGKYMIEVAKDEIKNGGEPPEGYSHKVTSIGNIQLNPTSRIPGWSPDNAIQIPTVIVTSPSFPEVSKWMINPPTQT